MTTVADIGVNVWADGKGATAEFERVRQEGKQTFNGLAGDVEGFAHKMHEGLGALRQFRPLVELGFGVEISRKFFEQVHEGVVHMVEGFSEGIQHGEGLGAALEDAGAKVLGLKTNYEQAEEAAKKLAEANEKIAKAAEAINKITGANRGDSPYPNLSEGQNETAKKAIEDLRAARDDAAKELKQIHDEREHPSVWSKINPVNAFFDTFAGGESHQEAAGRERAAEKRVQLIEQQIRTKEKELQDANRNKPIEKEQADMEDKLGEQQHRAVEKTKEQAAHHMEEIYRHMAEASKKEAERVKEENKKLEALTRQFDPFAAAKDKLKELDSVKDRMSADAYGKARDKIAEDYAKSKEHDESHHDPGKAEEYGSTAAFKAVEESRQAMSGLQDKQTELLEASKVLQSDMAKSLQTIAAKPGSDVKVVDFF